MILIKGQTLTIPVNVTVLAPFAHEDQVYYLCKALNSYADTFWIVSSDGSPVVVTAELLDKASRVSSRVIYKFYPQLISE